MARERLLLIVALIALSPTALMMACSSSSRGSPDAGAPTDDGGDDTAPSDTAALVGTFTVQLTDTSASFGGTIYDGVYPTVEPVTIESNEACALLKVNTPSCPTCASGSVCVADGACVPYPTARNLGTLTVTGLKESDGITSFTVNPVAMKYGETSLSNPPFAEGDVVEVATSGGDFSAFSVQAAGITPLVLANGNITLAKDQDLTLQWTAPSDPNLSFIHVEIDMSGGAKGIISCEGEDYGLLTVDGSLITGLIDLGVTKAPRMAISRVTVGGTDSVLLKIQSTVEKNLAVTGYTCTTATAATDCTSGVCTVPSGQAAGICQQ